MKTNVIHRHKREKMEEFLNVEYQSDFKIAKKIK